MRRGHPGVGGWRNENPRHFRSRNGGNPYFRPTRPNFPIDEPWHTTFRPAYGNRFNNIERRRGNHSEESRYRTNRQNTYHASSERPTHRYNERQMVPMHKKTKPSPDKPLNVYNSQTKYFEGSFENNIPHKNSMGDVDHRKIIHNKDSFRNNTNYPSPWTNEARAYIHRNYDAHQRNDTPEPNKLHVPEYSGHRPPSSDHYGCNPTISTIDKSNSFSRSIDDTVDMVRQRLLNRSESNNIDNYEDTHNVENQNMGTRQTNNELGSQEQPTKRRVQRQRHNDQSNCAKMKNKIVNQLFKMDKERIHKLMDNPNSSTKFEFAINSLITESQNSFNRHLRSVAEKSLCTSSDDFIQSDNNTIYEDTFMKQMQCILDPQDTVLLEDIKPMVMAELNNILQLDNIDSSFEEEPTCQPDEDLDYKHYQYDNSNIQNFSIDEHLINNQEQNSNIHTDFSSMTDIHHGNHNYNKQTQQSNPNEHWPLFDRRSKRISQNLTTDESASGSQYQTTKEYIKPTIEIVHEPQPLFQTNSERFSEEDDTFAELDNQYHVAVDHDFIEQDETSLQLMLGPNVKLENDVESETNYLHEIQEEIISVNRNIDSTFTKNVFGEQLDKLESTNKILEVLNPSLEVERILGENNTCQSKNISGDDIRNAKSTSNSRKRTSDLKPSHRKEKRKKSESQSSESNKQILNKNIIINVNDCANKSSENCEAPKSIFNLFFSKDKAKTVSKDISLNSDLRINKKENIKTPENKSKKPRKKLNSTSSSQSISPKDSNTSTNNNICYKLDAKGTLKTIDMFSEQPRKVNVHQAHRNTALTPKTDVTKEGIENQLIEKTVSNKQLSKSHVSVQVNKKMHSKETQTFESKKQTTRFCQTERKTFAVKAIQTDINVTDKQCTKANNALERMKEIDFEIQILLQEKFKLYSSIECKESSTSSMQNLGMTVLSVSPFEEGDNESNVTISENVLEDKLVDFPVEEIAINPEKQGQNLKKKIKNARTKKVSAERIISGVSKKVSKKVNKKRKSPNISQLEQLLTEEKSIENISLEGLQVDPAVRKDKTKKIRNILKKKESSDIFFKKYNIKECFVVLTREDINKQNRISPKKSADNVLLTGECSAIAEYNVQPHVVEVVVNDMQFDMLDVSEDIIIGDVYEVNNDDDKEVVENVLLPINEEIILDNSQSSMEEIPVPVTGQGEECKVYDYSADENLRRDSVLVTGNADAVLAIECVENNFLAASLDGNVYYFNSDGQLISTLRGSNLAVTCLTIVKEKYGTTVYTGSLDSRIRYYDLETGLEKGPECNVLSPIQTMDRAWDTVFVGTRTGFVLQFECKNNMLIPVSTVKFSEQSILALRAMKEGPRKVLLVAARSENVTIKDAQTGLLLRTLAGPKMTVYSLLYEDGKVYCGTSSHQIHVFDYTSGTHWSTHAGGKGAVCLRATGGLVFAGCYDGCVYVFREGEREPRAQLRGPSLMLLSLAVVGTKIIAGYKDRSLYIWKIPLCILQEMIL